MATSAVCHPALLRLSSSLKSASLPLSSVPVFNINNQNNRRQFSRSTVSVSNDGDLSPANKSFFDKYLGPASIIPKDPHSTNRWGMFIPAFATHVCLGAPYGWSAVSATMAKEHGFVASASADWALDLCTYPMSVMIASGGICAALLGKWTMKVGTRFSLACGGGLFGLGFLTAAAGVQQHNISMVYAGNLICGLGYGCSYTPPIQALIDWFPDKKGLASGMVIAGFGSGALFFTPMMNMLTQTYSKVPQYLGSSLETVTEGGKLFAEVGGKMQEVIMATSADLAKLPYSDLAEGFYLVDSGNTGLSAALATMGAIYASTIVASAFMIRRPGANFLPAGYTPPAPTGGDSTALVGNVTVGDVMKTPQFWLLFTTSTLLATGGMGLMSVAKPMISEVFTNSMPQLVTASFASSYLMAMAGGNLAGRLGWAAVSDKIGRKATFNIFTLSAVPIFASLPYAINQVVLNPSSSIAPMYLAAFCGSTVAAISIMGGVFAVLPAYEADLYGPKYVQAIHGRFLLSATLSTILGPTLLLNLRRSAEYSAITDLLSKVDPVKFKQVFGADVADANALMEAKTLTISKLMTIMPQGTIDPSPFIYNNTMYTMAGLVGVAAALHFMVRPVDKKFFTLDEPEVKKQK